MNGFQLLALSFAGILIIGSGANLIANRRRPLAALAWLLLWCSAAAAVAAPNATTRIANAFGIVRGADFISYCGVLGGLIGFSFVYLRFRKLDRQITLVVRELAMARAQLDSAGETRRESSGHGARSPV
jgi:hypothetical protein